MQNIASWLCLYLAGFFWFMAAGVFALFAVINPSAIKDSLAENNTYQKIVPAALDEAQKKTAEKGSEIPVNEPGVQAAVSKAFPSSDLQAKSETVLDGLFDWLGGDTEGVEFRLDFTDNKQVLATEIGSYAEKRAAGLPPCTINDIEAVRNSNVFTVQCLPPGVTPAQVGREASAQVTNNNEFLKDPVITPETLKNDDSNLGDQKFDAEPLKIFYQNKTLLQWVLPILVILLSVAGLALATNRAQAVKRLARAFLIAALSLGTLAIFLVFASSSLNAQSGSDKISTEIVLPVMSELVGRVSAIYVWFAVISLVVSVGLFISRKRLTA